MKRTWVLLGACSGLFGACGDDSSAGTAGSASQTGTASATMSDTDGSTDTTSSGSSASASQGSSIDDGSSTGVDSGSTTHAGDTTDGSEASDESGDDGGVMVCNPGHQICLNDSQFSTCVIDGSEYGPPQDCGATESCYFGSCYSECGIIEASPTSVGCSFLTTKADNFYTNVANPSQHDSLIAGNISTTKAVTAQLYFVPINGIAEQAVGAPVQIPAQGTHTWVLDLAEIDSVTVHRVGGVYRLNTDLPVVAYRHSPIGSTATNDASMLLPEHALTGHYVVASYPGTVGSYPSYFMAIATQDGTNVDFTVTAATAGGAGVPALPANGNTVIGMNRYDLLNVVVAQQQGGDLSGTVIDADGPLIVLGATECGNVPNAATTYCDHLEEVMLPLEYWGDEYVGAHAPQRGNETYYWRVYAGEDNVTIETNPPQPGFPINLDRGQYHQFGTQQSFIFTGDGPFLPVQYLEGQNGGAGTGDPSMVQMVPVEQFLTSYAFVTGENYTQHYAQIVRPLGNADVFVDGVQVNGYYQVGNYEVADWLVTEGAHFAESQHPFGIIQVGYTAVTSYAYPGGLKLQVINPQ